MKSEEVQVYVCNLPNNATDKQIITYLSTAGPIKDYKINKVDQRCNVHVIYYNIQSGQLAKKYLGTRQFQGRDLKINYDTKKQNLINVNANLALLNQDQNILKLLNQMTNEQKQELFQNLTNLYAKQGQMLLNFFQTKPKILEALMKKNTNTSTNLNINLNPQINSTTGIINQTLGLSGGIYYNPHQLGRIGM